MERNANGNGNVTLCSFRATKADEILNAKTRNVFSRFESIDAVRVRNVFLNYRRSPYVLRGVQMRVPQGTIYGLLGASGCGKTTLLKCICGCLLPNYGDIFVFGHRPDREHDIPGPRIGYMPQETSLYADLSIEELLTYFGRLYFMSEYLIADRIDEMIRILALPEKTRIVETLSGGQIRRVSFATALLHKPSLVILDEPTAGVDPILRDNIWKHLISLSFDNKITVIVTTHYIEEARRANLVGLMRDGHLLAEEPPRTLMKRYKSSTLEEVFLKLCTISKTDRSSLECDSFADIFAFNSFPTKNVENSSHREIVKKRSFSVTLWRWFVVVSTLFCKNTTRFLRHPLAVVLQYLLPISQIILLCICIGGDPFDVPFAVVNEESPTNLSDVFINHLDRYYFSLKNYTDLQTAIADTKRTKLFGVIHIPANFTHNLMNRLNIDREFDVEVVKGSTITIHADLTNKLISLTVERSLEHSFQAFVQTALLDHDINPRIAQLPIALADTIYGKDDNERHLGLREYMASGFLVSITFSLAFGLMALVLILERTDYMFDRHFFLGITSTQLVLGHFLSRIMFFLVQMVLTLCVTVFVAQMEVRITSLFAMLNLILIGFSGLSFGVLISAICNQINIVTIVSLSVFFIAIITGGVMWPLLSMPYWIRWLSNYLPITLPAESLRTLLSRGAHFSDTRVTSGLMVSFAWFIVLLPIGFKFMKYS